MSTQVTLDRYAGLRAEMESGMLRDEVLARAGLSVDEWTAAQHAWLESMGAEIERDRFELTNSYGRAFLARQRALQAASAPRAAVTPALVEAALPSALPPPAAPLAAPSYVAAMARQPVAEPPVISPPPPAPPPAPAKADLNSTAAWDMSAVRAALPFAREASAPAAAPPPQDASATDTQLPGLSPLAAPLPFRPAQPSAPSPPAIPAAKPALPAVAKPNPLLSGTMMSVGPVTAAALPFTASGQGQAAPLPPPPRPAPPPPPRAAPPPPPPSRPAGQPVPLPAPSRPAALPAPLPPPRAQPPAPPVAGPEAPVVVGGLTLEQHASLCAEIGFNPARTAETLSRYRVTVEAKTELDRLWKERFATDPAQEARWRTAYRTYFVFLTAQRT